MKSKALLLGMALTGASGAHAVLFTTLVANTNGNGYNHNLLVGTLPGQAGKRINILRIGIGGDADYASGKQVFQAIGGGLDFMWAAGAEAVNTPYNIDHQVGYTHNSNDQGGRDFAVMDVRTVHQANAGQSIAIKWRGTADWDGWYTFGPDPLGNLYDDRPYYASVRPWVEFEYEAVPEPATVAAVLLGLAGLTRRRSRA